MTGVESNDRLIQRLGADLTPVRRLPAPVARALAWLAIVTAIAVVLATFSDVGAGEPATFGVNGIFGFRQSAQLRRLYWRGLPRSS